jgi:uracil-DNA glycosylase
MIDFNTIDRSWKAIIDKEIGQAYFKQLEQFLNQAMASSTVFPPKENIFAAFNYTPLNQLKAVIIGQDPYHSEGQANGLSFSVNKGAKIPPSLRNIFKELKSDLGIEIPMHGDLTAWAKQGVLLLNATLTVRAGDAGSHQKKGWEIFTDNIIKSISEQKENVVFILWGNYAKTKVDLIHTNKHCVLTAAHPSPLARNQFFIDNQHFSKTNAYLESKGIETIDWHLD